MDAFETWLRLTAEAARGTADARRAVQALASGPLSPGALASWMKTWLPPEERPVGGQGSEELQKLIEQWWQASGVVPLYRYAELEKRCEELTQKLREAEKTADRLRLLLRGRECEAEAVGLLETWERVTRDALKAQETWVRAWGDPTQHKKEDDPT